MATHRLRTSRRPPPAVGDGEPPEFAALLEGRPRPSGQPRGKEGRTGRFPGSRATAALATGTGAGRAPGLCDSQRACASLGRL